MDESGAVVRGATVTLSHEGRAEAAMSKADGTFAFLGLAPGEYTIAASAPHLLVGPLSVSVRPGSQTFDLRLKVIAETQQLTVRESAGNALSTDASSNASALVIKGEDLDALADDPEDLASDLQMLAGPGAGPGGGGSIFVDGFSGGQLPSKESIREIRINQNPFSPEYDKLGIGRIEIFTKPGSDKFRGTIGYNLGSGVWNGRNPYAAEKAPFLLNEFENSASGPLGKRASFTIDVGRHMVDNGSISNGVMLDSQLMPAAFSTVQTTVQRRWQANPHSDYRIDENNTISLRYIFTRGDVRDAGVGGFDLPTRGYRLQWLYNTVQVSETATHGMFVNEARFQYYRTSNRIDANTHAPAVVVSGAFTSGGATNDGNRDAQNSYEFQDYASAVRGAHTWRVGVRLRGQTDDNVSRSNFNGTYTFSGTAQMSSIEQYRRSLIDPQHYGASQFTVNSGNPETRAGQADVGLFAGDEWRAGPNVTLSFGLRYEVQTNVGDRRDVAPRIAFAWAPGSRAGKSPKTVIRGGAGIFYDRFALANTLTAERYNGVNQQLLVGGLPAMHRVDAGLRAPYVVQSAATVERQLPANSTVAVTYTNSRGVHLLRSLEMSGGRGPIYLMTSSGIYNQNQLIVNYNFKPSETFSLFGYYVLNRARSDTDGLNTFPANPRDYSGEYGPATTDIRHRYIFAGTMALRWLIRVNPYLTMQSGPPFNITAGEDLFGTTLYNARPGIATDVTKPGVIATPYGLLDPVPFAGERILGRNAGRGPWNLGLHVRVNKTWGFGPERGPASAAPRGMFQPTVTSHRYRIVMGLSARNILNHTNPGTPIGVITSPLFGRSNAMFGQINGEGFSENASNRRFELQMRFVF